MNATPLCASPLIGEKKFPRKMENTNKHWLTKHIERYYRKLRYRAFPMMRREGGGVSHSSEKERKLSLILTKKVENFECPIWDY